MASKGASALTGAGTGAAAGTAIMPGIGTAVGAVVGGGIGYFLGDDDDGAAARTYDPDRGNFNYGLGGGVDAQGNLQQPEWVTDPEGVRQRWLDSGKTPEQIDQWFQKQALFNPATQDSYAAQRTRELTARQGQLEALGLSAQERVVPTIAPAGSSGQQYLQGADTAARQEQLAALGGVRSQTQRLNDFADRGQGPSAAQAQLQAGADLAAKQQLGFARAQPGGGGAALRQAAFNAGGITAGAANQAAILRAQEDQAYRAQQLQALGAAQTGAATTAGVAGQLRAGDQGFAQVQAGQANTDATNRFNVEQANQQATLASRGQNDSATLGMFGLQQGLDATRTTVAGGQSQTGLNYESAKAQGAGLGIQNYQAQNAQSNAETGMALGALSAGIGAYAQSQQQPGGTGKGGGVISSPTSDIRAKKDIVPVSLSHRDFPDAPTGDGMPSPEAYARQQQLQALGAMGGFAAPNLRPAQGYEYSYKDPKADGAGRYVGPMAQDLEQLPGVVEEGKDGQKSINAPRLTLANTAALSEMQRKQDELDRRLQLQALGGPLPSSGFVRPDVKQPDYAAYGPRGYHY